MPDQRTTEDLQYEENWLHYKAKCQKFKKLLLDNSIIIIAITALVLNGVFIALYNQNNLRLYDLFNKMETTATTTSTPSKEDDSSASNSSDCNAVGISLLGDISTHPTDSITTETISENIYFSIKNAEKDKNIKAIVIEIDSRGGSPVGSEEIKNALENSSKPVVAYIREIGTSGAYLAATGADVIFASQISQVGGIAVNASYLDEAKKNQQDGYTFNDLSTGKFKNIKSEDKPLTSEEKDILMKQLYATHDFFVESVAKNRKLDINKVRQLADGRSYGGSEAMSLGLIDKIGGLDDVEEYLKTKILNGEKATICWQR
jgi:signal peptide peptidase SppA